MLDPIPKRAELYAKFKKIYGEASPEYDFLQIRPGRILAIKKQPPLQQPLLVTLTSVDDISTESVLLDPNQLDPSGGTAIDFYVPSLDGKFAAVSISKGGSERGDMYVYDVETKQPLDEMIPRVQIPTGGGSFAWNENNDGIYYTRYPRPGERPDEDLDFYQQIYFHKIGSPESEDAYVIGRDVPKIAECEMETTEDGRYLTVCIGCGAKWEATEEIDADGHDYAAYTLIEAGDGTCD